MYPMVTIIVPVYNAEKTLRRCIDSVLDQEFSDFELLLVNDGSKDSSGSICREYAQKDSRIRLLDKPNTGVSDSRNQAISLAKGTYLQFLDSDDWITPNATKLFVETAEKYHCDMVISDFYRVSGERVSPKGDIDEDCVLTLEEFASHMIENPADFYYGVLWNKLYRRDIIENHQLRMDTEISWCEDFMFNLEYMRYCNVFFALKVPVYYYVKTKGSLASQGGNISTFLQKRITRKISCRSTVFCWMLLLTDLCPLLSFPAPKSLEKSEAVPSPPHSPVKVYRMNSTEAESFWIITLNLWHRKII